jgi:hypothetical protein
MEVLKKVILQQIIYLFVIINIMKRKKKKLFCVCVWFLNLFLFFFFFTALDTVCRDVLWNKHLINQIDGKMYSGIYNDNKTEYFPCIAGDGQG